MARQREPAVAQPVPVVGDGEPAGFLGECFLALQRLELVGFGDLGGDHLEHPVCEPAQRDRVVLARASDQMGFGLPPVLDRQRVDALDDHHGLFLGDLSGGHRVLDRLVVVVQGVREVQAALGVPFGLPGLVRPVAARVGGPGRGAEVEAVGVLGMAQLELGDLVTQLRERGQVGLGLGRSQGPQPEVGDIAQQLSDSGNRGRDPVLPGVVECRCHTGNCGIDHRHSRAGNRGSDRDADNSFRLVSGALNVVVSTSSTAGGLVRLVNTAMRSWEAAATTRVVPHSVAAPFDPMTTRSREEVSTPARWRSLLDRRGRGGGFETALGCLLNYRPMPTRGREAPLAGKRCPTGAPDTRGWPAISRVQPDCAPRTPDRRTRGPTPGTQHTLPHRQHGPRGAHARELRGGEAAQLGPVSGTPPHRSGPRHRHPTRASSRTGPTTRGEGRGSPSARPVRLPVASRHRADRSVSRSSHPRQREERPTGQPRLERVSSCRRRWHP